MYLWKRSKSQQCLSNVIKWIVNFFKTSLNNCGIPKLKDTILYCARKKYFVVLSMWADVVLESNNFKERVKSYDTRDSDA